MMLWFERRWMSNVTRSRRSVDGGEFHCEKSDSETIEAEATARVASRDSRTDTKVHEEETARSRSSVRRTEEGLR